MNSKFVLFARRHLLTSAALVMLAGTVAALETARMRLPIELAAGAERISAEGYGGANRGRYSIGEHRGDFVRIESRFAVFDPTYAANSGKSGFTLEGPGFDAIVRAECRFKERVVTFGVLTFDAKKLAYHCEIHDSEDNPIGTVTIGEPKPEGMKARLLARDERRGTAAIGTVQIDIVSVHQYERSKLSSQAPVGYLLSTNSEVVGAIELTDSDPTFILRSEVAPEIRRATLIAALSLSVLRDPANSMLDD